MPAPTNREKLRKWAQTISKMDFLSDLDDKMSVAELKQEIRSLFDEIEELEMLLPEGEPETPSPAPVSSHS